MRRIIIFGFRHGRIMEREKQLSILYQKQGRATQFASKADRDRWLQKEIKDYEQVLSSNLVQVRILGNKLVIQIEQVTNIYCRICSKYIILWHKDMMSYFGKNVIACSLGIGLFCLGVVVVVAVEQCALQFLVDTE